MEKVVSVIVIPAIDLRGGKCVRLRQGEYARETVYGDDPVGMARHWVAEGAAWLHLVDLDGAKEGRPARARQRVLPASAPTTPRWAAPAAAETKADQFIA